MEIEDGVTIFVVLVWLTGVVLTFSIPVALIWIAIHFARKAW